jgi:hypothetical protein
MASGRIDVADLLVQAGQIRCAVAVNRHPTAESLEWRNESDPEANSGKIRRDEGKALSF